jgi:hypothetical protein
MFVSTSAQILIAYGSTITEQIGVLQDPMLVQWCDSGNFFDWTPSDTNLARNFRIPIGSRIVAGLPVSNQNLIWTDLDLWIMNFIGFPNVYGFNMIGAGAGAAQSHAVQKLRGGVHWMGPSNFYRYAGTASRWCRARCGTSCSRTSTPAFLKNVRAMPNTAVQRGRLPLSVDWPASAARTIPTSSTTSASRASRGTTGCCRARRGSTRTCSGRRSAISPAG